MPAPPKPASSSRSRKRTSAPQPGAAVHHQHAAAGGEPQAQLQPASARCAPRSDLYEGLETAEGQVGLITYMRTDSTAMAAVADEGGRARSPRSATARSTCEPEGPRLQDQVEGRAGGARGDPADQLRARSRVARGPARRRRAAALPAHLAARDRLADGAQGARDDHASSSRPAATACAPRATRTRLRGLRPRLHRGPRRRRRGGREPAARRSARATSTRVVDVTPTQHFTEPPPRFTEATLIKALEEHGIGRPSTYAATISTIVDRGYVTVKERRLHPEPVGEIVTDLLVEHFGEFVDLEFTARMEEDSTRSPAASATGCRCCASSTARSSARR